jgi:hypothetical protein
MAQFPAGPPLSSNVGISAVPGQPSSIEEVSANRRAAPFDNVSVRLRFGMQPSHLIRNDDAPTLECLGLDGFYNLRIKFDGAGCGRGPSPSVIVMVSPILSALAFSGVGNAFVPYANC